MNINVNYNFFEIHASKITAFKIIKNKGGCIFTQKTLKDKFKGFFSKKIRESEFNKLSSALINLVKEIITSNETEDLKSKKIALIFKGSVCFRDSNLILNLYKQLYDNKSLRKKVENNLNPNLLILRNEKMEYKSLKNKDIKLYLKKVENNQLSRKIEQATLAYSLGISFQKNTGTTGSVIVKSLKNKSIGIFKPCSSNLSFLNQIKIYLNRIFEGVRYYLKKTPDAELKAEIAAYKLDRYFDFDLAPAARITSIGNKEGAFQIFLEGYVNADKCLSQIHEREYSKCELIAFQKMVVFDYLIGNVDRHENNWMVKNQGISKEPQGDFSDIKAIDNAFAYLCKHPKNERMKNQYKWKALAIANQPFTEEIKEFVNKLTKSAIEDYIESLNQENGLKQFFTPEMRVLFLKRADVLRKCIHADQGKPTQLGSLIADETIAAYLNS